MRVQGGINENYYTKTTGVNQYCPKQIKMYSCHIKKRVLEMESAIYFEVVIIAFTLRMFHVTSY